MPVTQTGSPASSFTHTSSPRTVRPGHGEIFEVPVFGVEVLGEEILDTVLFVGEAII